MKKHLLAVVVLAAAMFTTTTSADAQVRFGVKAGLNLSSLSLSDGLANLNTKHRAGFFAGVTADVKIPLVGLGADASVLYDQRNFKTGYDDGTGKIEYTTDRLKYLSIPINIKYTFGVDEVASIYFATGPQFSFNLDKNSFSWDVLDSAGKVVDSYKAKNFDFYWNIGVGFTVLNHLRIGYTYNIPCSKNVDTPEGYAKNKTNQISLTYLF